MCVDLLTDTSHCGACDAPCAFDHFCDAGTCAPICPGVGQILCGELCLDGLNDPNNCGACGVQCAFDEFCDAGMCVPYCVTGLTQCGLLCVDLSSDPNNCGACGNVCVGDDICWDGVCVEGGDGAAFAAGFAEGDTQSGSPRAVGQRPAAAIVQSGAAGDLRIPRRAAGPALRSPERYADRTRAASDRDPGRSTGSSPVAAMTRSAGINGVQEAPVCDVAPIQQLLQDGESFTVCQSGALFGREVLTTATVQLAGTMTQGPCAVIVPDSTEVPERLFSPVRMLIDDESGDHLCQPGEECSVTPEVQYLGAAPCTNAVATMTSAEDGFNPLPLS
jgi:hypothetical protein